MIKLALCLVILAGGGGAGWLKAYSYDLRVRELEDLLTVLKILCAEMEYNLTPLPRLMIQVGQKRETLCCQLLNCAGNLLETGQCHSITEGWLEAIKQVYTDSSLVKEDRDILSELGLELGKTDMEGQKSCFARTFQRLAGQLKQAEEEKARKGRMYRGLGFCAAILTTIILF